MQHTFRLALLVSAAICLCTGCSQGPATGLVTGEVTLDGKPLEKGHLEFTPVDGQGQTGGMQIAGGKFSGPIPVAKMRVKIHAPRVIKGAYQAYPGAPLEDDVVEALPARYHEKSNITLDVKRGRQEVRYDLKSK
jgi:hypothetical protein